MQYQEFKEKVNTLNEVFLDVIKIVNADMSDTIVEINQNLLTNKNIQSEALNVLEANLNKLREEKDMDISSEKSKILNLRHELEKEVKKYQATHIYEIEKEKIFKKKDEALKEQIQNIKKKILEHTQSINSLDKECLQRLKESEKICNETILDYNEKILEIEKKIRFETQKINEAILTPSLDDNNTDENNLKIDIDSKEYKKQINEIRNKGINEIANVKRKGYEEIKNLKTDMAKYSAVNNRDSEVVRAEYNLQIEEAKYAIICLKHENKILNDNYDFDAYKTLYELEKKFGLDESEIINQYYLKIYEIDKDVNRAENNKNNCIYNNADKIANSILNDDLSQYKLISQYIEKSFINLDKKIEALYQYLQEYVLNVFDVTFNLLTEFWDDFKVMQDNLLLNVIGMNYRTHVQNGFTYEDFNKAMKTSVDNFIITEKSHLENFEKAFRQSINNIVKTIETNHKLLLDYRNDEFEQINKYQKELNFNCQNIFNNAKKFNDDLLIELNAQSKKKYEDVINNQNGEKQELKEKINTVQSKYELAKNELNKKLLDYNRNIKEIELKENTDYKNRIKDIKNNIKKFKAICKTEIEYEIDKIEKEYKERLKEAELEKATKLKMTK